MSFNINAKNSDGFHRSGTPGLKDAILGGLSYLKETQVSNNRYYINSENYRPTLDDRKSVSSSYKFRGFLGNYIIPQKHITGCWPSFVSFLPVSGIRSFQSFFIALDYNLFSTASTAYSLLLFDDSRLSIENRFVDKMLNNSIQAISKFKNRTAYNFWTTKFNKKHGIYHSAPLNVPIWLLNFRITFNKIAYYLGLNNFIESELIQQWLDKICDSGVNKYGNSALFNIPNDADDTSLAIGLQLLYCRQENTIGKNVDISPLKSLSSFIDLNKRKKDIHNLRKIGRAHV